MFSGDELVTTLLRPSNIDGAKYAGAILKIMAHFVVFHFGSLAVIFLVGSILLSNTK